MEKNKNHIVPYLTNGGHLMFKCDHDDKKEEIEIKILQFSEDDKDGKAIEKVKRPICQTCEDEVLKIFSDLLNKK